VLSVTGIGPAAVLRMVKAIALAIDFMGKESVALYAVPRFCTVVLRGEGHAAEGDERTGVRVDVYKQSV